MNACSKTVAVTQGREVGVCSCTILIRKRVKQRLFLEEGLEFENLWYGSDFGVGSREVTVRIRLYKDMLWLCKDRFV